MVIAQTEQEGRKERFYLTTLSTHFNYGYMASEERKEGKVLFNYTINTFYIRLYCVRGKEGRKERFYLMTLSTRFIYGYMVSEERKEGRKGFI